MQRLFSLGYLWLLIGLCLILESATASPTISLSRVYPQVGQRGTVVSIQFIGAHLDTAEDILFYRPGIKCLAIRQLDELPHGSAGPRVMRKQEPGHVIEADLEIAADAPLGEYLLRVRTRHKLTEMHSFWVTPYTVVPEQHAYADDEIYGRNDTAETAQVVALNSTIAGISVTNSSANDLDRYRVTLEKGQRCTCQIINIRLGSAIYGGFTDMAIEVHAPSGKRVARNSRSALFAHDPVLSFIADEAGDYLITTKQTKDLESHSLSYVLHIGDFPRPAVTYPLGGQAGTEQELQIHYLDGTSEPLVAKLPAQVGEFEKSMIDLDTVSDLPEIPSPNKLQVAPFANVMETAGAETQVVEQALPIALNGKILEKGEKDWYRIRAKKGEKYRVRCYAMTLGSELDPYLEIRPADGTEGSRIDIKQDDSIWAGHDWEGHVYRHQVKDRLDPIVMFEPDVDGDYLVGISDTRREAGPHHIYRVEFQPHRDSVFTYYKDYAYAPHGYIKDCINIHQGATFDRPMMILNGFGSTYSGQMTLEAHGLPDHITFESPVFTSRDSSIQLFFSAPADAPLGAGTFTLEPKPVDPADQIRGAFAQTTESNDQRGSFAPHFRKTRQLAYSILEEAPFDISIEQPKIGLAKDAELDLKVTATRKGDYTGALYLESAWAPVGVTTQPAIVIPEGETTAFFKLSATSRATNGKYRFTLTARENDGGDHRSGRGYRYVCAQPVEIEVQDPYFEITLDRVSVEQGRQSELTGSIKYLRKFEGEAKANLLRLPHRVTLVEPQTIIYGQETVAFPIRAQVDTIIGQYKDISCDVEIIDAGQTIRQQTGSGVIRVDEKKGS